MGLGGERKGASIDSQQKPLPIPLVAQTLEWAYRIVTVGIGAFVPQMDPSLGVVCPRKE